MRLFGSLEMSCDEAENPESDRNATFLLKVILTNVLGVKHGPSRHVMSRSTESAIPASFKMNWTSAIPVEALGLETNARTA